MPTFEIVNIEDKILPYFDFTIYKNKLIFYFILGIIILFTFLSFNKKHNKIKENTENKYIIHEDEICSDCVYYTYDNDNVKHIIWNGDYTTTFLICWYFMVRDEPVQPIYILSNNLDLQQKFNLESNNKTKQSNEINIMKLIRKKLIEKFPYKKSRLLPTYYVYSINKNNNITSQFIKINRKYNIINTYEITKYERICRFSYYWHQPIHIDINKSYNEFYNILYDKVYNLGTDDCIIKKENLKKELQYFNNLRFSIIHLSKNEIKNISLDSNNYFYDILLMTYN
jgi:hypothetical protein